ncbi:VanZ family protein [Photobacterium ganghwense]|uniref:VanZ family protein n=1 Tax=Photobacterium ganghwense TaxID=320778 RepID=UPI004056BE04
MMTFTPFQRNNLAWFGAVASTLFIAYISLVPAQNEPEFADLQQYGILFLDKILHLIAYGGLTFLFLCTSQLRRYPRATCLALILYGSLLELTQGLLPLGREFSLFDALANVLGVLIIGSAFIYRQKKQKARRLLSSG